MSIPWELEPVPRFWANGAWRHRVGAGRVLCTGEGCEYCAPRWERERAWIARELGDVVPEPCTIQYQGMTVECERRMPVWPEPEAATVGETAIDWDAAAREQPARDTGD